MDYLFHRTVPVRSAAAIVAVAVAAAVLAPAEVAAADAARGEVWLISTRCAPRAGRVGSAAGKIGYWRLSAEGRWAKADGDDLLGDGRPLPTTVVIHGNWTGNNRAIRDGWYVYNHMQRDAADRPFRFVIWSWPSDRIRGRLRRDAQVKAAYSDVQGYYLADCLRRVDPKVPVCLVGYSFGARVITGALHLLAGGQVAGRRLAPFPEIGPGDVETEEAPRRSIRAVLVAAAVDAGCLMPGRRYGQALSQVDTLLVTVNGCDPVLRWYPRLYRGRGPQAMGYSGLAWCGRSEKIELLNVRCSVGHHHDWPSYMRSPGLLRRLARYTFLDAAEPDSSPQGPGFPELPEEARSAP